MKGATPCGPSADMTNSRTPSTTPWASRPGPGEGELDALGHVPGHVLDTDPECDRRQDQGRHQRGRPPGGEQPDQHRPGRVQRVGPEQQPPQADEVERRQPGQDGVRRGRDVGGTQGRRPPPLARLPHAADTEPHAVQHAPRDEGPRRPMPQAPQRHGDHQIAVGLRRCSLGSRPAGCTGSRGAIATASCASGARSPAASRPCTAR